MPSDHIAAVVRALSVLSTFRGDQHTATLAQLAKRTGIHKTTLLRILATLEANGFIRRLADGRYRLGPELLRLGRFYQESFDLIDHVRPVLSALVEQTGESAAFYIREGDARVCLCRTESPRSIRHHVHEGQRLPLTRGTAGRVLLAFMNESGEIFDRIRRHKIITLSGDRVPEVGAVCAPVFSTSNELAGALQVSGPTTRFDPEAAARMEPVVLQHARELTRTLGGDPALLNPEVGDTANA